MDQQKMHGVDQAVPEAAAILAVLLQGLGPPQSRDAGVHRVFWTGGELPGDRRYIVLLIMLSFSV